MQSLPKNQLLDDKMLQIMRCCKCNQFLNVAPIMMFTEDETCICGRCYKTEDYTDDTRPVHNILYEALSSFFPFPCKFKNVGCKELRSGKTLFLHEDVCSFRPCDCPVENCDWSGIMQDLKQHYKEYHSSEYIEDRKMSLEINEDFEETKFVSDNEMELVIQLKYDVSSQLLWCSAVCVSSAVCSASYYLKLEFKNEERVHSSIVFKTRAFGCIQPININEALQIDIDILKKLLNTSSQQLQVELSFSFAENKYITESNFLKEFECPICNHYMVPPIFICSNGHSICHFCKTQVEDCPICRAKLNNKQDYTLERIIEQMNYPCKYFINGCRLILPATEIETHENICTLQASKPQTI